MLLNYRVPKAMLEQIRACDEFVSTFCSVRYFVGFKESLGLPRTQWILVQFSSIDTVIQEECLHVYNLHILEYDTIKSNIFVQSPAESLIHKQIITK